jgi:hypothetical protein
LELESKEHLGFANDCLPITEFLKNMSASADVLAMAKVEVDLAAIPEGKNVSLDHRTTRRATEG